MVKTDLKISIFLTEERVICFNLPSLVRKVLDHTKVKVNQNQR